MNEVLRHHGIIGQKWGIRRYQNKDGTLTAEGKKKKKASSNLTEKQKPSTKKERRSMTEKELDEAIRRMAKEVQLKELEQRNVDNGKRFANEVIQDIGKRVLVTAATGAALYGLKVVAGGNFTSSEFASAVFKGGAGKK